MFLSRMLQNVRDAKYIPSILTALLIALGFVYLSEILGGVILELGFSLFSLFIYSGNQHSATHGGNIITLTKLVNPMMSQFIELFCFSFIIIGIFFWVKRIEKRKIASLGFYKKDCFKNLAKGILTGILLFTSVVILMLVMGVGKIQLSNHFEAGMLLAIMASIPLWLIQGGAEDLVTRGWLFPMVSARFNLLGGILISSVFFGILHIINSNVTVLSILNVILYGVFACLYMMKTDNMWSLAGVHGAWNFVQGNIYGIQVSGQDFGFSVLKYTNQSNLEWLSGGQFGAEGSIFTSLILIIGICFLYYSLKKAGKLDKSMFFSKTI